MQGKKLMPEIENQDLGNRRSKKFHFGTFLLEKNIINEEQLNEALVLHKQKGIRIGKTIVEMGLLSELELAKALGAFWNIPFVSLKVEFIDPYAIKNITETMARKYKVIPISLISNTLTIAMVDPINLTALKDLEFAVGHFIKPVVCTESEVINAINHFFKGKIPLQELIKDWGEEDFELIKEEEEENIQNIQYAAVETPIVKLVNVILTQACQSEASDIHLEPEKDSTRVRFRIDGILQKVLSVPRTTHEAMVSRIKILSGLDIAERRRPQDGRLLIKFGGKEIDFRVATAPTINGETVVIRVLDQSKAGITLEGVGFADVDLKNFQKACHKPSGFILVTGPTGSGKTTTLYAALNEINSIETKIITIEDPIEYRLFGINQMAVHQAIDFDFAKGFVSMLRQDPDTVLVGEIRDLETAQVAIHAALTGHLIFSTLHTIGTAESLLRLIDLGIPHYLVGEAVTCVASQRLVRKLCPECKIAYKPDTDLLEKLNLPISSKQTFCRPKGCITCNNTGYRGRTGVFEVLEVNEKILSMLAYNASSQEIREMAMEDGMKTMWQNAVTKVADGITSLEEIQRTVSGEGYEKIQKTLSEIIPKD